MVSLGHMFGVVLDPGNYIKKLWSLTIPEGMKEVLWKEMNGAQVLSHRYFGQGHAKSDMGRFCPCGMEMTLGHILLGCDAYGVQPLMAALLTVLSTLHSGSSFKTLSPDAWGSSPWYPLLALKELEESAYPIVKGRKKILKSLKKTRQRREWIIGNYYWAIWKWRMKEIHDASFVFIPANCVASLNKTMATPVPAHLLRQADEGDAELPSSKPGPITAPQAGDLTKLPPPVSRLSGQNAGAQLSDRGKSILRAIQAPATTESPRCLSRREAILRALTDNAYA